MTRSLSDSKLRHFKRRAKALLRDVQRGENGALSQTAIHPGFSRIGSHSGFKLADAQLVIARQQGFAWWPQLRNAISRIDASTGALPLKMNSCVVELPATDLEAALEAFKNLGFRTAWQFENDFASVYGGGNVEIFIRLEETVSPHRLYLDVDDAESFYAEYAENGEVVEPIRDTPWGMREFTLRVFDGHLLRVGQGLQSTREIDAFTHPSATD
jgi:hypothetical protein